MRDPPSSKLNKINKDHRSTPETSLRYRNIFTPATIRNQFVGGKTVKNVQIVPHKT